MKKFAEEETTLHNKDNIIRMQKKVPALINHYLHTNSYKDTIETIAFCSMALLIYWQEKFAEEENELHNKDNTIRIQKKCPKINKSLPSH